jgi:hypothetical protein
MILPQKAPAAIINAGFIGFSAIKNAFAQASK